jgi:BirA family transcriptional regulator, biotin operon repressor / biotin---[acetyl-CoA-carboxylase] ligase
MHQILKGKGLWNGDMLVFDSLPSTNKWAIENIASLAHGDVIRAVRQTAGHGRFDRKWFSPDDRCLTLSIIIKHPHFAGDMATILGQLSALAVRATLDKHGIAALVKWPNDVLANDRKIAGILTEGDSCAGWMVLGIGLNINSTSPDFAGLELMQPVTSMAIEKGRTFDIGQICSDLLAELGRTFDATEREGTHYLFDNWKAHDSMTGKRINVQTDGASIAGKYAGMDENGRIRLIDGLGKEHLFWSGDVSLNENAPEECPKDGPRSRGPSRA